MTSTSPPQTLLHAYTMLYLSKTESSATNSKADVNTLIDTYILNAALLALTLKRHNIQFSIISNDPMLIKARAAAIGVKEVPSVQEFRPSIIVPPGIPFAAAHYKIDAFETISKLREGYSLLLDADIYCSGVSIEPLLAIVRSGNAIHYDITGQVLPAYGYERILADISKLFPGAQYARWIGGEIVGGPGKYFADLASNCKLLFENYLALHSTMHHSGDEMLITPAVEKIRRSRSDFIDAGAGNIIVRHWTGRARHAQFRPKKLREVLLLHLPQCKGLLALTYQKFVAKNAVVNYRAMDDFVIRRAALLSRLSMLRDFF